MLSAKQWKLEPLLRLVFSLIVCFCVGSLVNLALPLILARKANPGFLVLEGLALVFLVVALALARKPWTSDKPGARLAVVLICFYAGVLLFLGGSYLAHSTTRVISPGQMLIAVLGFQGAVLVLVPGFVREQELNMTEAFGLSTRWQLALGLGIVAACLYLPIGVMVKNLTAWFLENNNVFPMHAEDQSAVRTLRSATSWLDRIALGAATVLIVPAAEELLFRGLLYPWIKFIGFPKLALWGSSFLFATFHLNLVAFPALFLLAIILAILYERTGNLLAPIACHSLFNAVNLITLYRLQNELDKQPY